MESTVVQWDPESILKLISKASARSKAAKQNKNFCELLTTELESLKPLVDHAKGVTVADDPEAEAVLNHSLKHFQQTVANCLQLITLQDQRGLLRISANFESNNTRGQFIEALNAIRRHAKYLRNALRSCKVDLSAAATPSEEADEIDDVIKGLKAMETEAMDLWGDEDYAGFLAKCEDILKLGPDDAYVAYAYYNMACASAKLGQLDNAATYLHKAVASGFNNVEQIKGDHDLDAIRESAAYLESIAAIESKVKAAENWRTVLTEKEIEEARALFQKYDTDGSLTISPEEFSVLIREIDSSIPADRASALMAEIDSDKNGVISFEEFLVAFAKEKN